MISPSTLQHLNQDLNNANYNIRSGTTSEVYYITPRPINLTGNSAYCLIFERSGWRLNILNGNLNERNKLEQIIINSIQASIEEPTS